MAVPKVTTIKTRCNFCKEDKTNSEITKTRDGRYICTKCVRYHRFCEICGSLPVNDDVKNQKHYDELCFK